jgi:hypothetical protein
VPPKPFAADLFSLKIESCTSLLMQSLEFVEALKKIVGELKIVELTTIVEHNPEPLASCVNPAYMNPFVARP